MADQELQEAATIKAQARAALRAARLLMANKATPKMVGDALDSLEGALLKTWSDLATEAQGEETPAQEATDAPIAGEFIPLIEKAVRRDQTIPIKLIQPGWGSSGHYSSEVLQRDGPAVFKKGTKCFWNHQTEAEERERPEGDLRDLAAEFITDARWNEEGKAGPGLYADAKVFAPYVEAVNELAPHIGVSIRALGRAKQGEVEGRKGNLIEQIVAAKSVDFVTTPGAGGKILELFESARPAVPEEPEVVNMDEVERLKEAGAALESEKAALLQENARLHERILLGDAAIVLTEALGKVDLPDVTKTRLRETLGKNPPAKDGELDAEGYAALIAEAVKGEQAYIAQIAGAGKIVGMGKAEDADAGKSLRESFKRLYQMQGRTEAEAESMAEAATRGRR